MDHQKRVVLFLQSIFVSMNDHPESPGLFNETVAADSTWIEVILPLALPTTYTYSVPDDLIEKIKNIRA